MRIIRWQRKRSVFFRCISRYSALWLTLTVILASSLLFAPATAADQQHITIGVLAIRGKQQCLDSWSPTAAYLSSVIPTYTFVIKPLDHNEVNSAVASEDIDFILTNSSSYVEVENLYGVSRIATLKEKRLGRV